MKTNSKHIDKHATSSSNSYTLEQSEAVMNETVVCHHCGDKPCFWKQYKEELVNSISSNDTSQDEKNNLYRKKAYQLYVSMKYGKLGRGNRVKIPFCVQSGIRSVWPERSPENYMGFKDNYDVEQYKE